MLLPSAFPLNGSTLPCLCYVLHNRITSRPLLWQEVGVLPSRFTGSPPPPSPPQDWKPFLLFSLFTSMNVNHQHQHQMKPSDTEWTSALKKGSNCHVALLQQATQVPSKKHPPPPTGAAYFWFAAQFSIHPAVMYRSPLCSRRRWSH